MEEIRNLSKMTKEELLRLLVDEAGDSYEEGVYAENGDIDEHLDRIENIIYVLRNCNYEGSENEQIRIFAREGKSLSFG